MVQDVFHLGVLLPRESSDWQVSVIQSVSQSGFGAVCLVAFHIVRYSHEYQRFTELQGATSC
ncbi:hypothetical protein E2C01_008693 [Portunus trituberculatus]|uniref:Uncharacterized protein n=1 Tax=Portunus trituberculatus TaxID=210409 RepID=A0A5B7D2M8_PORTR|nr:hypothetical protein [Portunus trituberculatus]